MYLLDEVGVEGDVFYGGGEVAAGVVHQAWEEGFLKLKSKQKYFAYKQWSERTGPQRLPKLK